MKYGEIAEPLRNALVLDEDGAIASAVAAFAEAGDVCGAIPARASKDGELGYLTERALLRAIAGDAKNAQGERPGLSPRPFVSRASADAVDLRDFAREEAVLVLDAEGRPAGVAHRRTAAGLLLEELAKRLSEAAKRAEPLGGEAYAKNRIFYLDSHNTADELCELIDAIAENEAKLLKILKFSADSIFVADGEGVTIFVNDAFVNPSAAERSAYINVVAKEFERRGHITPSITPMIIREGKRLTILQDVVNKFGRTAQWITTGVPIFDESGALEMIVTNAKNIEEYEQLKQYLEKTRKKSVKLPPARSCEEIVCFGGRMREVMELAEKAAETDCTVLITGESGTGKGLLARHIHARSARKDKSLIEVNCSSIPEMLFESEFFGYESGAFTGAKAGGKPGLLESAQGGTMLLDEIGDMVLPLQAKLLNVLQDKRVTRVGGLREIEVDVRIIAATNHSLTELIEAGSFRADLYYRLNLFPIHIAPLRERPDDIPVLIDHFLRAFNAKHGKRTYFSDAALAVLRDRPWPGNVRQLEYFVERMVILYGGEIVPDDIRKDGSNDDNPFGERIGAGAAVRGLMPLRDALEETERRLFILAAESGRSSYEIARILETSQTNAYRKIKKYLTNA
ncbi:MAG: sigma 54-interacting transcriptional regulator [Clostridiales Family XIII bacterium]|jgi:transcriptional regulator with PAS, ATPase and Fis domain|nr:sigma 54-interacting transcriptional regulator [Clostridiales Family XIII bacterium]